MNQCRISSIRKNIIYYCGNGRGQPYITPFQCRHVKQNTENPQQEKTRKSFEEIPQQKKEKHHVANWHHRNRGDSHHPSTKTKDDSLPSQPKLLPRPATDSRLLVTLMPQSHHHVATTLVCNSQWWKISTVNHYFSTPTTYVTATETKAGQNEILNFLAATRKAHPKRRGGPHCNSRVTNECCVKKNLGNLSGAGRFFSLLDTIIIIVKDL